MNILELLQGKKMNSQEMVGFFDHLDEIDCEFMHGQWKGLEVFTDHPMNGVLDHANWYGKLFVDNETVFPLVCLIPKEPHCFRLILNGCH